MTELSGKAVKFFTDRGIALDIVTRMQIYSASQGDNGAWVPDGNGAVIAFPTLRKGREVATKYRAPGKRFFQRPGGLKTFYNEDVLDDPGLGTHDLVIVEGEMDLLACLQAGYKWVVSVPDGAPPDVDQNGNPLPFSEPSDRPDDKFGYVLNNWERLARVKRIVLATDNDGPGIRLREELARRLGKSRCLFVEYPKGAKDLNQVLMELGRGDVIDVIHQARLYPIQGLFRWRELPKEPDLVPLSTGWEPLDKHLKVYFPAFMTVTGRANHGKSTWALQLVAKLALVHGLKAAIISPEMNRKYVRNALMAPYLKKSISEWRAQDYDDGEGFIDDNFVFIEVDDENDFAGTSEGSDLTVEWLLQKAQEAVVRYDIRVLLIDPWNELDHARRPQESVTDYTSRVIREIKRFARKAGVLVIVVAHPSKASRNSKEADELELSDVSDSQAFENKSDIGVVIARKGNGQDNMTSVKIVKVKYQPDTGSLGEVTMIYDLEQRLFVD